MHPPINVVHGVPKKNETQFQQAVEFNDLTFT